MRLLIAYLRERFNPRLYLPLALIIALPASAPSIASVGADVMFALLLLAQFSPWDDLADRDRDARAHPDRVLVRATSIVPIATFCSVLAAVNIGLALQRDASGIAATALIAFICTLAVWYPVRTSRTGAGEQVLLSKYAVMVIVVAGERVSQAPMRIIIAALALHLVACVYEGWHDRASPLSIGGPR
jgi:hypothetical protein